MPSLDINEELSGMLESNPQQSASEMYLDLNVRHSTVCKLLRNIGIPLKLDKWVLHHLSEKKKVKPLTLCSSLKVRLEKESFLKNIITCDKNWTVYSNPHREKHWIPVVIISK